MYSVPVTWPVTFCAGQSWLETAAGQYVSHTSRPVVTGRLRAADPPAGSGAVSTGRESDGSAGRMVAMCGGGLWTPRPMFAFSFTILNLIFYKKSLCKCC